jgi:hypothetical protein
VGTGAVGGAFVNTQLVEQATAEETGFFARDDKPRAEIVEGLVREGQLVAFAGPYGVGKSPFLTALTLHVIQGIPFVGRQVNQRPVVLFDFETPGATYRRNMKNLAARLGVPVPEVPDELDVYLEHDDGHAPATKALLHAVSGWDQGPRGELLGNALRQKPNALVLIDPVELLFRVNTGKKTELLRLYEALRLLLAKYPHAAICMTFNLRKRDKKNDKDDLLLGPRGWLEEVCGTLDILNRSDVRLGMDFYSEDARVINGIRRGEEIHPLIVRPVEIAPGEFAGFEQYSSDAATAMLVFTDKQRQYWDKLPREFRFDDVADSMVPRATLDRLLKRAKSVGLVEQKDGIWRKVAPVQVER